MSLVVLMVAVAVIVVAVAVAAVADGGDDVGIQIGRCSLFKYSLV